MCVDEGDYQWVEIPRFIGFLLWVLIRRQVGKRVSIGLSLDNPRGHPIMVRAYNANRGPWLFKVEASGERWQPQDQWAHRYYLPNGLVSVE